LHAVEHDADGRRVDRAVRPVALADQAAQQRQDRLVAVPHRRVDFRRIVGVGVHIRYRIAVHGHEFANDVRMLLRITMRTAISVTDCGEENATFRPRKSAIDLIGESFRTIHDRSPRWAIAP
jgi:hypothetical protein